MICKEAWQSHMSPPWQHSKCDPKQKWLLERSGTSCNGGVGRHSLKSSEHQRAKEGRVRGAGPQVTHSFSSPIKNRGKTTLESHSYIPCSSASNCQPHFPSSLLPFLLHSFPVFPVPVGGTCMGVIQEGDIQRVRVTVCSTSSLSRL